MTDLSDDQDFDHAVAHAQMMWRQHYKSEVTRRHNEMEFDERTANMAMAASKEQSIRDGIAARNAQTRLDDQLRKERLNEALTHKLKQALLLIAIAIVIYTLITFYRIGYVIQRTIFCTNEQLQQHKQRRVKRCSRSMA